MTKRNKFIWSAIQVICWLILAGYAVLTGALLFNFIYSLFNPIATHNLHLGLDLSELFDKSLPVYSFVFFMLITISALKGFVFYIVIGLFKKLNLVKPFSENVSSSIWWITYSAFAVGVYSLIALEIAKKLSQHGYNVGVISRYWDDSGAYLMMSAILFVIALIFQKGIELQNENDLTV